MKWGYATIKFRSGDGNSTVIIHLLNNSNINSATK